MDMEKVIKGLEICSEHGSWHGLNCEDSEAYKGCPYRGCETGCIVTIAKDAIELLKEQEAMHWISVKDRLPTYAELKDDCVLVLFDDGTICSTGFDECIEGESIFGEWRQNFDPVTLGATDSYWMPLEGITHWMPIPKLMQEGR